MVARPGPALRPNRPAPRRVKADPCAARRQNCPANRHFDLSPSSVPSRKVPERSSAGTSQVSKRCVEASAAPGGWEPVHPQPVVAFCRLMRRPGGGGPAARCGSASEAPQRQKPHNSGPGPRRYPAISAVVATAHKYVGKGWVRPSTTRDRSRPGGPLTENSRPSKSGSKRFGEPLLLPGFCPLYVRNHRRAAASGDRR